MRLKYLFALLSMCWLVLQGQSVLAATCDSNPNSTLSPGQYIHSSAVTGTGTSWVLATTFPTTIQSATLVDCQSLVTRDVVYKYGEFRIALNTYSNIDFSQTVTYSGRTYYKIKNTGNDYVDTNGYIYFRVSDNSDGATVYNLANPITLMSGYQGISGVAPTLGVRIYDLNLYFTTPPTQATTAVINIGTVYLGVRDVFPTDTLHEGQQQAQITLNLFPENYKTCLVDNVTVTLPTISISALSAIGSEAGRTNFSITTACNDAEGDTLSYSMADNGNTGNTTDVLTNTGTAGNVGIKVYDADTSTAVKYDGTTADFGTLGTGETSQITKKFYATYYNNGTGAATAGTVIAQATITVDYK